MKKSALLKDTLREIKKSFGRFASIFAIVGIGVAFFAGVKGSVPVMKTSADTYFDEYNMMDLKLMTTIGLTKEDASAIKQIAGVDGLYAGYSIDAISMHENTQKVFKLMSYPMNATSKDSNYINQMRLIEGRLPEKENECVIEYNSIRGYGAKIGEEISFESGTKDKLTKSLKNTTYTIVGEVTIPYYLSFEKGSSTVGNGKVDNYAILPDTNFKNEYFSELFVTIQGAKEINSYQDSYFDVVKPTKDNITKELEEQTKLRFVDIKEDALKRIRDGRKEYTTQKQKYENGIKEGKQKLENAARDLENGLTQLANEKKKANNKFADSEALLIKNEKQVSELEQQYSKNKPYMEEQIAKIKSALPVLVEKNHEVTQQVAQLTTALAGIEMQLQNPALSDEQRQQLLANKEILEANKQKAEAGSVELQAQIDSLQGNLTTLTTQLTRMSNGLTSGKAQLASGRKQLADGKKEAQLQFKIAQKKLDDGKKEYNKGMKELRNQEKDGAAELKKADETLTQSEKDMKELKDPSVYVLDRKSHYSYMDYGSAADRMGAIAKIFPLFFFLVSALVCLTTMTRMVDEQRQEIGTLKAMGYTKGYIAMKYVSYAGIASICGGVFGAVGGMIVFPTVIYNAWAIMYNMPGVQLVADLPLALLAIALASLITIAATILAVYKELMETPALLMRPKSPKNGKKIILERVPFIWNHFNFIHKVTARNILRYKKRFLMTVIGISGCTALLVAGFGIRDSISEIASKQYQDIYKFDMSLNYKADSSVSEKEKVLFDLKQNTNIKEVDSMAIYHGMYADAGEDKGIDIYVPEDVSTFPNFISLKNRLSKEPLTLQDNGAIITEKIARTKDLSIGDSFAVNTGEGVKKKVKIIGITENYVGHALYMTPSYYKEIFGISSEINGIYAVLKDSNATVEQTIGNTLMKNETVDSLTFYSGIASTFEDTISSLSFVVVVLIISAGMLAFVVLYNLTNVNISERLREIATIKVLGFYDREVSSYVYRENIVLTLIGAIAGIFVGIGLHSLIMSLAELDTVMFGRNIYLLSFVYSMLITMAFAIIVNLVMYRKLQRIPMVESLKSVE